MKCKTSFFLWCGSKHLGDKKIRGAAFATTFQSWRNTVFLFTYIYSIKRLCAVDILFIFVSEEGVSASPQVLCGFCFWRELLRCLAKYLCVSFSNLKGVYSLFSSASSEDKCLWYWRIFEGKCTKLYPHLLKEFKKKFLRSANTEIMYYFQCVWKQGGSNNQYPQVHKKNHCLLNRLPG